MARLRASIVTQAPVDVYVMPEMFAIAAPERRPRRRKKQRGKKKKSGSKSATGAAGDVSATLSKSHFPSLQVGQVEWVASAVEPDDSIDDDDDDESEESTKHGEEEEELKSSKTPSDASSTATTASMTASSGFDTTPKKQAAGSYAAALLRSPTAAPRIPAVQEATREASTISRVADAERNEPLAPDMMVITAPPTWGGGFSFADVLRKD